MSAVSSTAERGAGATPAVWQAANAKRIEAARAVALAREIVVMVGIGRTW
jgi:hypothetical protein